MRWDKERVDGQKERLWESDQRRCKSRRKEGGCVEMKGGVEGWRDGGVEGWREGDRT